VTAIEEALLLARRQLDCLREGDVDGFLAGVEAHARACETAAATETLDGPGQALLQRLIDTNDEVVQQLDLAMADAARRLATMQRGRNAAGAYLETMPHGTMGGRAG